MPSPLLSCTLSLMLLLYLSRMLWQILSHAHTHTHTHTSLAHALANTLAHALAHALTHARAHSLAECVVSYVFLAMPIPKDGHCADTQRRVFEMPIPKDGHCRTIFTYTQTLWVSACVSLGIGKVFGYRHVCVRARDCACIPVCVCECVRS